MLNLLIFHENSNLNFRIVDKVKYNKKDVKKIKQLKAIKALHRPNHNIVMEPCNEVYINEVYIER